MKIISRDHRGQPIYYLVASGTAYEIHPRGRRWALQRIRSSGDLTKPLAMCDTAEECRDVAVFCEEVLEEIKNA